MTFEEFVKPLISHGGIATICAFDNEMDLDEWMKAPIGYPCDGIAFTFSSIYKAREILNEKWLKANVELWTAQNPDEIGVLLTPKEETRERLSKTDSTAEH